MKQELKDILKAKKGDLHRRWLEEIYASYPPEVSNFLRRKKDRFANPAGHALSEATLAALDGVLEGAGAEDVCQRLEEIIKIRAVQDFTPSQAVSFIFLLRKAVRNELGEAARDPRLAGELADIDREIDQICLYAFDIFVRWRERFYELRVSEIKRNVTMMTRKLNTGCSEETSGELDAAECPQ